MDKSILIQLASLIKEIEGEEKRIKDMQTEVDNMAPEVKEVSDIVTKGKRGKKPLGLCRVHGFENHKNIFRRRAKLRERKARKEIHLSQLDNLVIDAEEYIYSINDSELRNILLHYCIDKKTWDEVAGAMGEGYTGEACKQKFSRFMRKK